MCYFLGFEIKQTAMGIHVSQKKYTEDVLKQFKCKDVNQFHTYELRHQVAIE